MFVAVHGKGVAVHGKGGGRVPHTHPYVVQRLFSRGLTVSHCCCSGGMLVVVWTHAAFSSVLRIDPNAEQVRQVDLHSVALFLTGSLLGGGSQR